MHSHLLKDQDAFMRYLDLPGDESPIVWLHGVVCSSTAELLPVAVEPKLSNHRSLVLDFLGYGYSDRPEEFDYTVDSHARTVISLLEELEIQSCHLVGHSFGGTVAVHVAAERPDLVRSLVAAEPNLDAGVTGGPSAPIVAQTEEEFVRTGYRKLIEEHEGSAREDPAGISARHLGMFRMMSPRGVHRTATSLVGGTDPSTRLLLKDLEIHRTFVAGEWSEEEEDPDLIASGVHWDIVPEAGHPMGLQNPAGFAEVISRSLDGE